MLLRKDRRLGFQIVQMALISRVSAETHRQIGQIDINECVNEFWGLYLALQRCDSGGTWMTTKIAN